MTIVCYNSTGNDETNETIFDNVIIESIGIKIWHLVFMILAIAVIITIVCCCVRRCRIPRTRQDIEASTIRDKVTKKFRKHLEKLPYDNLKLIDVLDEIYKLEKEWIDSGCEEEELPMLQKLKRFLLCCSKEAKEANIESGSSEKKVPIEMVMKPVEKD